MACRTMCLIEGGQQVVLSKEAQVVATDTQRGIQLERVHIIVAMHLVHVSILELDLGPSVDTQATRDASGDVEAARRTHFDHQRSLDIQHAELASLHDGFVGVDPISFEVVLTFVQTNRVVEAIVVPSQTDTREEACRMAAVEGDADISDVEIEHPALHGTQFQEVIAFEASR